MRERAYKSNGLIVKPLAPASAPVSTFKVTYPPRRRPPEQRTHDGYEWLYVVSGRLRLLLGEHDLVLGPGEAAEFDTRVPHAMSAVGDEPAETISIFNESGASIHTRARARRKPERADP